MTHVKKEEVFSLLLEGVPAQIRCLVWKVVLFPEDLYDIKIYSILQQQTVKLKQLETMTKDLHRTFPMLTYFSEGAEREDRG